MRWPAYLILVYVAVGLQIGAGEYLRVHSAKPDLVLLAVIFITINARRDAALLGAFGIGLVQDLVTLSPLGLYAVAYSVVGLFIVNMQELFAKSHPVTHCLLGLLGGLLVALVVLMHGWIRGPGASISELAASALYTALLAPVVLGGLNRLSKTFGFSRRRARSY